MEKNNKGAKVELEIKKWKKIEFFNGSRRGRK